MKNYNINDAYQLVNTSHIKSPSSVLVKYVHKKSGATLFYLDRKDDNKTFAIGFKTPPEDDTGVFHILEHCVLQGSEKYPVKDPMTELIKGSLYTYLNAFTYPDKTVYPVSSKNDKAFLDLINVYMDAVLHPLVLKNKSIFLSEGHRIDFDEEGKASINGVVYNEMSGAYSSAEELTEHHISKLLYKGGSYSYDSGGWPDAIPTLGYDDFKVAHSRFYHPSNSYIFIDGSVVLADVLALIDSYLCEYQKSNAQTEITVGDINEEPLIEYYPEDSGDHGDKTRLTLAYRGLPHSDYLGNLAINSVIESIADSNVSPLKKPILDSGLCENVHFYYSSSNLVGALYVQFINVKDGCEDKLIALFNKTVNEIIEKGIDRKSLMSIINLTEFKTREADFGSFPRGMVYMNAVLEYAIFGEDPADAFDYDVLFGELRKKLDTGYYETLLSDIIGGKHSTLILKPKSDFSFCPPIGEFDENAVIEELKELSLWISTPDSPEALATIPTLTLGDIGEAKATLPTDISVIEGATVLDRKRDTSGITYADLFFDVSDISGDELSLLRLITLLIGDAPTENGDAKDFKDRVKMDLGDLSVTSTPIIKDGDARLYLTVRASALSSKTDILAKLLGELIYTAKLDDGEMVKRKIDQIYTASLEAMASDALSACISRVSSRYDSLSAIREYMYGYEFHRYLEMMSKNPDLALSEIGRLYEKIKREYLSAGRLILSITSENGERAIKDILSVIKKGKEMPSSSSVKPFKKDNEAILIPGTVGYSAYGSNIISELREKYSGSLSVLSSMLTYEHLWGEIRVRGGAYDTGIVTRGGSGGIIHYSYRDPSPKKSIEVFESLADLAEEIIEKSDLTKYIISTVGSLDSVSTPRSEASSENLLYLSGKPKNHTEIIRNEVINTTCEELKRLVSMLKNLKSSSTYCIAAPKSMISDEEKILKI